MRREEENPLYQKIGIKWERINKLLHNPKSYTPSHIFIHPKFYRPNPFAATIDPQKIHKFYLLHMSHCKLFRLDQKRIQVTKL